MYMSKQTIQKDFYCCSIWSYYTALLLQNPHNMSCHLTTLGGLLYEQVHVACVSLYMAQSLSTPIRAEISTEPSTPRQRAHKQ